MGDAIFTSRVREHLLGLGYRRPKQLQSMAIEYNSAKGQAKLLEILENQNMLNADEQEIVRRGKNAHVKSVAKNADYKTYLKATAFEALLGYLYLYNHRERLEELLEFCMQQGDLT
jgi:ribonuclease-3 family protein